MSIETSALQIKTFTGTHIREIIPVLARLRIAVFREYPYLYDGSVAYESEYLSHYASHEKSLVVTVYDKDKIVGASTAMPLLDYGEEVVNPFKESEYNTEAIFYFGESVLDKHYRGLGFGRRFFSEREEWAKKLEYQLATFCAVNRLPTDTRQPAGYKPLNAFWERLGYKKQPGLECQFTWKEIDSADESPKSLTFWTKDLEALS